MFYLVLPSNSSFKFHPENTVANYTTRLPQEVTLTGGEWEVGLESLQYNHSWLSFNFRQNVGFSYAKPVPEKPGTFRWVKLNIEHGYYATKGELVDEMRKAIKESAPSMNGWHFLWNHKNDVVTIHIPGGSGIVFTYHLAKMLGFGERTRTYSSTEVHSTEKGSLNEHLTALYVYCDIVKPRVVGDSIVSLLRTVPVGKKHGENVTKSFHNIHYVPLSTRTFHEIEIDIRGDTGKTVAFEGGRVVATLHFRKKNPF